MANTLATPTWVLRETTVGFINSMKFAANLDRSYDDQYKQNGAKVGNTVYARLPQIFTAADGQAFQAQNLYDQTTPITLTNQKHVDMGWSTAEETTQIEMIRERYIEPAALALANAADTLAFANVYKDVYQSVGTPGTTPSTFLTYLQAGVKLSDSAVPTDGRRAVIDTMAQAYLVNAGTTLFNPQNKISENYKTGMFSGPALGMDEWYYDQNRPVHVTGTFTASTPVVNGANQTGTSLITSGWASGGMSLKRGDIFTIAGVNQVNPESKVSTGRLQQFVLTADITDTTGAATLSISPSIITSGQLQSVDASPASGAAIQVWSANTVAGVLATTNSPVGMIFNKGAFAFVMADLVKPNGGATTATIQSKQWGISIRMVEQYDARTDQNLTRLDILCGAATVQARLAVRVQG